MIYDIPGAENKSSVIIYLQNIADSWIKVVINNATNFCTQIEVIIKNGNITKITKEKLPSQNYKGIQNFQKSRTTKLINSFNVDIPWIGQECADLLWICREY